jgi:glycosyltransferase involved in cell wall biosynthesis
MKNVLVSIIIPCFNSAAFMRKAIESALNQRYPHKEIILVDNNSTDETGTIMQEFKNKFPGDITILKELRPGGSSARNAGIAQARGEWIQFLDSDDILKEDKIETQMSLIRGDDDTGIIVGSYEKHLMSMAIKSVYPASDTWIGLIETNLGITSANLFNRSAVESVGCWDENLPSSQEYDLMFRILRRFPVVKVDRTCGTIVIERKGSISTGNKFRGRQISIELRFKIAHHLAEIGGLSKKRRVAVSGAILNKIKNVYRESPQAAMPYWERLKHETWFSALDFLPASPYNFVTAVAGVQKVEAFRSIIKGKLQ